MAKKKPAAGAKPAAKKEVAPDEAAASPEPAPETAPETAPEPAPGPAPGPAPEVATDAEKNAEIEAQAAQVADTAAKLDAALTPADNVDSAVLTADQAGVVDEEREPEFADPESDTETPALLIPDVQVAVQRERLMARVKRLEGELAEARGELQMLNASERRETTGPVMAPGKCLTTLSGIKGPGDPVKPDDFTGGMEAFKNFVDEGYILE